MTSATESTNAAADSQRPVVVQLEDISKRFVIRKDNSLKERVVTFGRAGKRHQDDFWALSGVSVTLHAGDTIGLIGHNGSGKSTLLKVIGGILDPSSGSVQRRGRVAALLELGAGFHPDLTGRENVFLNAAVLGLSKAETEARFDEILTFSGIGEFIDTQVKFYSSGMYVRLAFAVAVHTDPDILIVDEVLAVGDEAFQRKCLDKIKSFQAEGRTIILVSHSLDQVADLCHRAILLDHGKIIADGEPQKAISAFRDILEGRRQAEADAAPKKDEVLENGRVLSVSVDAPGPIAPGADIVISAVVEHTTGIDEWACAVQIDTVQGQKVYGLSSEDAGVQFGPLLGRRTINLTLHDLRLGRGKYFVNLSLLDTAGRHLHDLPQAASFNVVADGGGSGVVYAEATFSDAS